MAERKKPAQRWLRDPAVRPPGEQGEQAASLMNGYSYCTEIRPVPQATNSQPFLQEPDQPLPDSAEQMKKKKKIVVPGNKPVTGSCPYLTTSLSMVVVSEDQTGGPHTQFPV